MQLTDVEKKMVATLQKRRRTFIRWRWLLLLTGVFCIGNGIYIVSILQQCFKPDFGAVAILAAAAPMAYFFIGFGAWLGGNTLINWNGKPEVDLLVRLLEDQRHDA
jgi:hypothetical protein